MEKDYQFLTINNSQLDAYNEALKEFEKQMKQSYPLGSDSFVIDHGLDYFSFFRRLGEVYYFLIRDKEKIIGTGCAILRESKGEKYWYLCDLKIANKYRGKNLSLRMFIKMFWEIRSKSGKLFSLFSKAKKGYLIAMDPNSKQIIHIFRKIKNLLAIDINPVTQLFIYSVPKKQMMLIEKYLVEEFGEIRYLSLAGKKDLVLSSNNKPLELYHLQHGPFAAETNVCELENVPESATIMFCLEKYNHLINILEIKAKLKTNISATVIANGMEHFDWNNILTSDI